MNDTALNRKKTIILVEDEADLRSLYAEILVEAGYLVEEAPDGDIASDKINRLSWDMLLLDIMLPNKDGLQILKDCDLGGKGKKGPIIMLTNLNAEAVIQEAFKFGSDGYLIKSEITPDKLLNEVQSFLPLEEKKQG